MSMVRTLLALDGEWLTLSRMCVASSCLGKCVHIGSKNTTLRRSVWRSPRFGMPGLSEYVGGCTRLDSKVVGGGVVVAAKGVASAELLPELCLSYGMLMATGTVDLSLRALLVSVAQWASVLVVMNTVELLLCVWWQYCCPDWDA